MAAVNGCSLAAVCTQWGSSETGKYRPPTIDSSAITQLVPTLPCLTTHRQRGEQQAEGQEREQREQHRRDAQRHRRPVQLQPEQRRTRARA